MDPYGIVNAVMWLGAFGGALIIGSSIAMLAQSMRNNDDSQLQHYSKFDEFYDASDKISFRKILEIENGSNLDKPAYG